MSRVGALLPLLLCVSVLVPSPGGAQTPDQPVAGYVTKRWTTADGLSHNWISAALQARDGYLWLGTNNAGLVRFDGVTFTTFNLLNTPALLSNDITSLLEDRDGTLWIGTEAGLVRYRDGTFGTEPLGPVQSHPAIVDLELDQTGRVWVARDGEVARRDGNAWTAVLREAAIQRLRSSSDGTMWVATRQTLIEWRGRVVRRLEIPGAVLGSQVFRILEDRVGQVWIGTSQGLWYLQRRDDAALHRLALPSPHASALFEDSNGLLWIGAGHRIFTRTADGTITEAALESDSQDGGVSVITEDREGNIWLGVEGWQGGLYRLKRQRVTMVPLRGLPCSNIGAITQGADGTIWGTDFCDDTKGIFALRGDTLTKTIALSPGPGPLVASALLADTDGTLWVGTYGGALFHLVGGKLQPIQSPARLDGNDITAFYRHPDGTLWLGTTRRGVLRWRDGQWSALTVSDGLPTDDVRTVVGGRDGDVWIGMNGGVSHYRDGELTTYRVDDGVPSGPVRAIYVDDDGAVWTGTYGGGLARWKNGAWFRLGQRDGILDTSVHRIIEDEKGYLWLTGDRGIRRASKRDLNAIADGQTVPPDVALFDATDGMGSIECNGMAQPAGWRMRDGTLYVPTQAGIARIDPVVPIPAAAAAPQPQIERVIVDGAASESRNDLVVAPGYRDLEFHYTAPAFARPELVQFRYRLEGYSDDWIDVGTRRVASFVNLPPGHYRFLLSARSAGAWSTDPATASVVLQPYFYQRRSAQVGLGVLTIALTAAGAWGYVRRTRQRASELERAVVERTREVSSAHERLASAHQDLVQAQQDAEQAHGQVLGVLNQLDVGALVLGAHGIVRYASASAQRVLRKDATALVGQSWSSCLPLVDADRAQVRARVEGPSSLGADRIPVQMVIAGARHWTELDVCDEPPPGDGRIIYLYDVTEVSPRPTSEAAGTHGIVGRSTAMHILVKKLEDVARVESTVLIEGETGVGKELAARAIHRASRRAERPFVAVNAAGLTESLLASQLFGYRRGAFTGAVDDQVGLFEAANGGTLFLDEIGDMPTSVQSSLLRVLQEREITRLGESQPRRVDVRFLAATHRDLEREVSEGRFREDLLYRVRVATVRVPPLRNRVDDIPLLVDAFLQEAARDGERLPSVSREAMDALMRYRWPGNVRELRALIERALVNAHGGFLRLEDLPPNVREMHSDVAVDGDADRNRIVDALRRAKGNRAEAARLLGIGRTTLYRRLREYGLDTDPS